MSPGGTGGRARGSRVRPWPAAPATMPRMRRREDAKAPRAPTRARLPLLPSGPGVGLGSACHAGSRYGVYKRSSRSGPHLRSEPASGLVMEAAALQEVRRWPGAHAWESVCWGKPLRGSNPVPRFSAARTSQSGRRAPLTCRCPAFVSFLRPQFPSHLARGPTARRLRREALPRVADVLSGAGHDVRHVRDLGLASAGDPVYSRPPPTTRRVLLTRHRLRPLLNALGSWSSTTSCCPHVPVGQLEGGHLEDVDAGRWVIDPRAMRTAGHGQVGQRGISSVRSQ